jgi:hypothetical protein
MWASFTTVACAPEGVSEASQVGRPSVSPCHEKLAAMAFKVRFSGQAQPQDYGDDDGFEFLDGGVLAIHFGDETKRAEFYPPAKWDQVTADPDHVAGLNTPYVDEDEEDEDFDDVYDDYDDEEGDYEPDENDAASAD